MKRRKRATGFLDLETYFFEPSENRSALILGPISRTWYSDMCEAYELVEYLDFLGFKLRVADERPFCDMLFRVADEFTDAEITMYSDFFSDPFLGETAHSGIDLVVAFVARGSDDVLSASDVVAAALLENIPVLALYADGTTGWITESSYNYAE